MKSNNRKKAEKNKWKSDYFVGLFNGHNTYQSEL